MQSNPSHLIRQQIILKQLGFYTGAIDGVWGPTCIEAMQKFENRVDLYRPARPSCGLPFADGARLPAGMWFNRQGFICSDAVPEEPSEDELAARIAAEDRIARGPRRKKPTKPDAAPAEAASDEVVEESPQIVLDTTSAGKQHGGQQQQNHKQKNNR